MTALETDWITDFRSRELPVFPTGQHHVVAVVAAHPDDETLGASGCLQALHASGCRTRLVVASDGEAAFPDVSDEQKRVLGRRRRAELVSALRVQGMEGIQLQWLGFPDSGLTEHIDALTEQLAQLLSDVDCCLLPWPQDPHPDHQATARAALSAAAPTAHCWSYPIWMWHWKNHHNPEVPWQRAFRHYLSTQDRNRKTAALREFASQRTNGPDGSGPVLPPDVLEHFERDFEIVFREPRPNTTPMERFNTLYEADKDPWNTDSSSYERRKRAVVMACLPRNRYHRAAEPGCGTGRLTLQLASRCDRLLASDGAPLAVAAAREHVRDEPGVTVEQSYLPSGLPEGPLDLVVLSEILYYLSDEDLDTLLESMSTAVEPGGDVVAVHWQQWPPEATRSASEAHHRLAQRSELQLCVEHIDEGFSVHVLRRR